MTVEKGSPADRGGAARPPADAPRRPRVVITRPIFGDMVEDLARTHDVIDNQDDVDWTPEELGARLAAADAVLADPSTPIGGPLLAHCPRLRVVSNVAVGFNNIDVAACSRLGIVATNTPDVLNEATADHAWALMLAAARRVVESDRWLRAGHWKGFAFDAFLGADVYGATLGILGMGRIGSAVARRAAGFAMRVIYHNRSAAAASPAGSIAPLAGGAVAPVTAVPSPSPSAAPSSGAGSAPERVDMDVLLRESDFLVILVPYSPATHHMIGAAELTRMKKGAVLVNVARGGVVDDAALVAALRAGRPAAAALDVMENEPMLNPDLLPLENIVLTPHIGSGTDSSRRGMANLAIQNMEDVFAGRRPRAMINPEIWESRRRP